jgi:hypothetical protein
VDAVVHAERAEIDDALAAAPRYFLRKAFVAESRVGCVNALAARIDFLKVGFVARSQPDPT